MSVSRQRRAAGLAEAVVDRARGALLRGESHGAIGDHPA